MCRIHLFMREAEQGLRSLLGQKTLADLSRELEAKAPQRFTQEAAAWFAQRRSARAAGGKGRRRRPRLDRSRSFQSKSQVPTS